MNSANSLQGQNSIIIEFFSENNLDLNLNNELTIEQVSSGNLEFDQFINKDLSVIFVNKNSVEIVDSSGAYDLLSMIDINDFAIISGASGIGYASYIARPEASAERKLQSQLFRALSVKEVSKNEFEVTGLEYNPYKFRYVDKKGIARKPKSPIPPQADMDVPEAPTNLILTSLV